MTDPGPIAEAGVAAAAPARGWLGRLTAAARYAFGAPTATGHRERRLSGIVQGVVTGLAARGVGVAVSLVSVPLAIRYLGAERYGVWALIGSLLAWAQLADFGIGNGLTNALTTALGQDRIDQARQHISTAFAVFGAIALVLGAATAAAWPWLHWSAIVGVHSRVGRAETGPAIAVAIGLFLAGFPLSVIGRVYAASQEGRLSNYWGLGGRIAALAGLFVVTRTSGGLVAVVISGFGVGLVTNLLSGIWLFRRHRPQLAPRLSLIHPRSARGLVRIGGQFFLIQILALLVFETDNFVIAHFLGAAAVPPYSLTYSLFGYTGIIQSLLFSYMWVGFADAIARRDAAWVRRAFRANLAFSVLFTVVAVIPLVFIARPFIAIWAGPSVVPPQHLVYWIAGWSLINAYCSPIASLLAAASRLRWQMVYSAVAAAVNLAISLSLVQSWGASGVIAGTVLSYFCFIVIPISVDATYLIRAL